MLKTRLTETSGVNLTVLSTITPPPSEQDRQTIADSGVEIVEIAGSNPAHLSGGNVQRRKPVFTE